MPVDKYGDASLILVPSGFKAGKLYSQIPTDGDGDLTVSRASSKTQINSSGKVETISSNVPAMDFSLGSCPFLALDPSSTNLCLQSEDFTTTWTAQGGSSVSANTTTSPDGTANADTLTLSAAAASRVQQLVSMSTSTEYTFSVYAKVSSGTKDFRLAYNDGSSTTASSDLTATDSWQRFEFTFTTAASHSSEAVRITNNAGGTAGDLIVWGAQLELNGYATGYITTTTTAVARSSDVVTLSNLISNSIAGATSGTIVLKAKLNVESGNINLWQLWDGVGTDRIRITSNDIQVKDSTNNANISNVYTADADGYDESIVAVRWNGTNARAYKNGTAIGNSNFTGGAGLTQLYMEGKNDTSWYKEILFYNTALDDADMATVTTP